MVDENLTLEQKDDAGLEAFGKAADELDNQKGAEQPLPEDTPEKGEDVSKETPDEADGLDEETDETSEGEDDSQEPAEAGEEASTEDALKDIDPEVLEYCRNYFGADEKIIQMVKLSPELFDDVRAALDEEQQEKPQVKETKTETQTPEPSEIDKLMSKLDPDVHGAELVGIIKALAQKQTEGQKVFSEEQKRLENERKAAFTARIDSCFDRHSKKLPQLGHSSQRFSRGQSVFRQRLLDYAAVESKYNPNLTPEQAIDRVVTLYLNQGGKKAATQEILDKINKHGRTAINKPTRRHSQQSGERKYDNFADEAEERMAQAEQEAGLTS